MGNAERLKTTMRAWGIEAYGQPPRLLNLPVPAPRGRDVLIKMRSAEVGDWDDLVREGVWSMERPFPLVLGLAGSGIVAAVGKGVADFVEDDTVYVYSYPLYDNGAWAEYMLVPASYVARAPTSLQLTNAGVIPIAGLTAHETLTDILDVQQGEVVLITAAAGGVGHLALQIASNLGARVVATASPRNHDFVRSLGAETVIDYTTENLVEAIRARYPDGVNKALNGVASEMANEIVWALREDGQMVDLVAAVSVERPDVRIVTDYIVQANADRLAILARMIDEGQLRVVVQQIFPFEQAPDALNTVLSKQGRGKMGIKIA
jgi:NADPH:quinone reductase